MAQHQTNKWGPHGEPIYTKTLANYEKVPALWLMYLVQQLTHIGQLCYAVVASCVSRVQQAIGLVLLSPHLPRLHEIPHRQHCPVAYCGGVGDIVLLCDIVPMSYTKYPLDDVRICQA